METTIMGYISVLLGLYWDIRKENGNYYSTLGLYWDYGKENRNYYSTLGLYWGELWGSHSMGGCQNYRPFLGYPKY